MKKMFAAAVLALAMTPVLVAQNAPQGGRGAYQPTLWWGDEMFPKWPYPAGDAVYADLDGKKIKRYINEITAISRKSRDDGRSSGGRRRGK